MTQKLKLVKKLFISRYDSLSKSQTNKLKVIKEKSISYEISALTEFIVCIVRKSLQITI